MPCYRCGTRQVDPDRGATPWARGVSRGQQVLVCPCCQAAPDWTAELDRCARCDGTHLVRRLGEVECRDCRHVWSPAGEFLFEFSDDAAATGCGARGPGPGRSGAGGGGGGARQTDDWAGDPRLAEDVAHALARLFGASARGRIAQR